MLEIYRLDREVRRPPGICETEDPERYVRGRKASRGKAVRIPLSGVSPPPRKRVCQSPLEKSAFRLSLREGANSLMSYLADPFGWVYHSVAPQTGELWSEENRFLGDLRPYSRKCVFTVGDQPSAVQAYFLRDSGEIVESLGVQRYAYTSGRWNVISSLPPRQDAPREEFSIPQTERGPLVSFPKRRLPSEARKGKPVRIRMDASGIRTS